ncbi:class I SAM-dependent methyltransferase [Agrobacterium tumefaciens]|uniref:class I SAM-dependent methyltransferase n=1 Tax=Agrobacterium tumefaciens TaxID=358 RepID=UPI0021D113AA|nr:class I SAM-dependent methyltransferase [Agrobacterium tumefaciens]UXS03551.1 class I SAM-dependent methyltransferase [Agrobacterium tumefaciens]
MHELAEHGRNDSLRDEIKAYWSGRAATFDLSPGHEIFSDIEREAWHALVLKHLGPGDGRAALDLASGTGVISHLMDDLGYRVTGMDWSEDMLQLARAKAKTRGRNIRFFVGDAERTMEPDESADVIITRHLVWTLVDPKASFEEWFRVLKPGGRLLIIDGDFVNTGLRERLVKKLAAILERTGFIKADQPHRPADSANTFNSILSRVYFAKGARAPDVAALLRGTGFMPVTIDQDLRAIHRAQAKNFTFFKSVLRGLQHRYAVVAVKPDTSLKA